MLAFTATAEGRSRLAIEGPGSVRAGLVKITLRNADDRDREAQIIRIAGGSHTPREIVAAITSERGTIPGWLQDGGGVTGVEPGRTGSATQVLAPGDYAVFDATKGEGTNAKSYAERGAIAAFEVTGPADPGAELPEVPATITAREYSFSTEGLTAGVNRVRFENAGKQLHEAVLLRLNTGATVAEATRFFSEEGSSGASPADFDTIQGTAVVDGGVAQNVELELEAGTYVAVCFIQDRAGGPPHAEKGMISGVTVK